MLFDQRPYSFCQRLFTSANGLTGQKPGLPPYRGRWYNISDTRDRLFEYLLQKRIFMKSLITILFLHAVIAVNTFGQKGVITGSVADKDKQPLAYVHILLKEKSGDKVLKSTVSDINGAFELKEVENGTFSLTIACLGYADHHTEISIDSLNPAILLPVVLLEEEGKNLEGVTITERRKFIEMKADKIVLNIEDNIMASGSSAFDMIRKGPAVSTDKDDNIRLKGSTAQIYIDGKPAWLAGQQLTDFLKNLPADAVSRIEIISNPSGKYEAQGSAGIINIRLKKSKKEGFNGSAYLGGGIGRYPKAYGGVNLNYRKNKVNVYGGVNLGWYESFNELTLNSIIGKGAQTVYQDRENYWHPVTTTASAKAGIDYSLDGKSTLGFLVNGYFQKENAPVDNKTVFSDIDKIPELYVNTRKTDEGHSYNTTYNINYRREMDTLGGELNVDADYVYYRSKGEDVNYNYYLSPQYDTVRIPYIFRNQTPANVSIYSFKTDYTRYVAQGFKIESGLKGSLVKTDNNLVADSIIDDAWVADYTRSNHFIYQEMIGAAYVNANREWKKWSLQAGLRAEFTHYISNSVTLDQVDRSSYLSLFPSLFVSYKVNEKNTFNFSYTRRINRPGYQDLNPFTSYVDPYTIFKGNPYLKPSFSHSLELKHNFRDLLFTSVSYAHRSNESSQVIIQDPETRTTTNTTKNIGYSNFVGLDITLTWPVTKWWSSDNNAGLYYFNAVSDYAEYSYNTDNIAFYASSNNTFTLPNSYKIQAGIYYSGPSRNGYTHQKGSYDLSFGIQKQLWKDKASLKFSVSNIGINKFRAHLLSDKLDIMWTNQWEGPRLSLTFTQKFGNNNVKANRQRQTGSSEERNRVNLK